MMKRSIILNETFSLFHDFLLGHSAIRHRKHHHKINFNSNLFQILFHQFNNKSSTKGSVKQICKKGQESGSWLGKAKWNFAAPFLFPNPAHKIQISSLQMRKCRTRKTNNIRCLNAIKLGTGWRNQPLGRKYNQEAYINYG